MQPLSTDRRVTGLQRAALCLALGIALCTLQACVPGQGTGSGPASVDRAERLLRQGNATAAAQMYERLAADNPPPDGPGFSLAAARAWLSANRGDDAQRVLDNLTATLPAQQNFERELLRVETQLARGQYAPAWRQAAAIAEPRAAADATRLFRLQQQAALRASQPLDAVRAGIARERVAATDAERNAARRDLLGDLRQAVDRGVRLDPAASREPLVRGWLEIGQIAAAAGRSPLGAGPAIERWRSRFPGHPAASIAYSDIVTPGASAAPAAGAGNSMIGLLLPLTGRQSVAATLVRDGFQAAMAQLPADQRPELRIYDTGAMTVAAALQGATGDGVGFIVGPLTREEVQAAAQQHTGTAPLLLLNSLGNEVSGGRGLYQYALSPEDEARQIARQAFATGQKRAIVFTPTDDWGTRVAGAFTNELTRAGGVVLSQATYDPERSDYTAMISQALAIEDSRARARRVQQVVGGAELKSELRRRQDVDLIFTAGRQPLALRQILPLLRFFNAGDVPTYMTSDGVGTDAVANRDLDGVRYPDMPWVLEETGPVAEIRTLTQPQWAERGLRQSRLFAFGYDAGALTIALRNRQPNWPIAGLTGRLSITPDGQVERDLDWARMNDGAPRQFIPVAE
jgi:outer membrane PBP1 activator LpoA protein